MLLETCTCLRLFEFSGYYDGVIFHRYASAAPASISSLSHYSISELFPTSWSKLATVQERAVAENRSMEVSYSV